MKLTKKEQAWLERFQKTMAAAPSSLRNKIWSFTIGDDEITLYDRVKFEEYYEDNPEPSNSIKDHHQLVSDADCKLDCVNFPFPIESTAG